MAYADFVTAMMSFFLLLWLLSVTTSENRRGIADYFAPAAVSFTESGAGGMFGGRTVSSPGARMSDSSPISAAEQTLPRPSEGEEGSEDSKGKNPDAADNAGPEEHLTDAQKLERETTLFKEAADVLNTAIQESAELREFAENLSIKQTPEGLKIDITDQGKLSMFASGSAMPYEKARDLLRLVGRVLARLPNAIAVTGHTDSAPFSAGSRRDNWGLSADRANVSRQELVVGGVADKRIARVVGLADREPQIPEDPRDGRNRRISILVLRQVASPDSDPLTAEALKIPAAPAPSTPKAAPSSAPAHPASAPATAPAPVKPTSSGT